MCVCKKSMHRIKTYSNALVFSDIITCKSSMKQLTVETKKVFLFRSYKYFAMICLSSLFT